MPKTYKPFRRSVLRLTHLEDRLAPAVFNIAAGDIAAFRAAITASNTDNQSDTINLAAGATYTFSDVADTADGGNALPSVVTDNNTTTNTLTINGNGATLVRSAAAGTPFFRFIRENVSSLGAPPPTLTVNGINFGNGQIDPTANFLYGGAVYLAGGNLSMTDCGFTINQAPNGGAVGADQVSVNPRSLTITRGTFSQNSAVGPTGQGAGGAVYSLGDSTVTIADSTFNANTSMAEGGALRVQTSSTTTTISGSTFTNNTANGGNGGGGIFLQGTTNISTSNISGNISAAGGGGVWDQGGGPLTVTDTTVSNNNANGSTSSGGGIFIQTDFTMTNCTVVNNRASNGGGIAYVNGGNNGTIASSTITDNHVFFALAKGGGLNITGLNLQLGDTVIAANVFEATVTSGTGPDVAGTVNSLGYNLIGNGSGATFTGTTTGNLVGTTGAPINPLLGPLQNNGGRNPTRKPLAGSPVLNAGDPNFASPPGPANDERGTGYARVQLGRIDIGATEAQVAKVASVVVNGGAQQRSRVTDLTITFNSVVTLPANPANAFTLINTTLQNVAVTLSVDLSASTPSQTIAKLSWTGPITEGGGSLIDGNYTLTILGSQITGEGGMQLDGNGDGTPGGDNVSTLYRLFGDVNGDKAVDGFDLTAFRNAFGSVQGNASYVPFLDFNGDGAIDGADLTQFRNRFGVILP
jgi:hypothetical protein